MSTAKIHVLDQALINQIAAGEVVGRPANVIKELIENALDAGASRIEIDTYGGGLASMRVHDNGVGMVEEDVRLCIQPHTTSKIQHITDLERLGTFGFRGEALASIAAVSRVSLHTRQAEHAVGTAIEVEGSVAGETTKTGCAPGTTIEVRDLFYNVPARLKFLKSTATETAHIADTCLNASLANPHTRFILRKDGASWRDYMPSNDLLEHAILVLNDSALRSCRDEHQGIHIRAVLSPPEKARSSLLGLHLFVNQRPVRDRALAHAISHAYGSVLPPGRYPTGAVFIELPSHEVDVNVHPQKTEIRFAKPREVYETVRRLLTRHLEQLAWSVGTHWSANRSGPSRSPGSMRPDPTEAATYTQARSAALEVSLADSKGHYGPIFGSTARSTGFFSSLNFLAQVRRLLLICEGEDALYVIDQHAADERVRFFQLHQSYHHNGIRTQRLLFPERVECSSNDVDYATQHAAELAALGLECHALGEQTLVVQTIPALAQRVPARRLLRDALDELTRQGQRSFSDVMDTVLATMACHAAIRAGDHLSPDECRELLANLDHVESFNLHCPHGRPIVDKIDFATIERRLGR